MPGGSPSVSPWRSTMRPASPCSVSMRAAGHRASASAARFFSVATLGGSSSTARRARISVANVARSADGSRASSPSAFSTRSAISAAAARVNVVAQIRSGATGAAASLRARFPIDVRPSATST